MVALKFIIVVAAWAQGDAFRLGAPASRSRHRRRMTEDVPEFTGSLAEDADAEFADDVDRSAGPDSNDVGYFGSLAEEDLDAEHADDVVQEGLETYDLSNIDNSSSSHCTSVSRKDITYGTHSTGGHLLPFHQYQDKLWHCTGMITDANGIDPDWDGHEDDSGAEYDDLRNTETLYREDMDVPYGWTWPEANSLGKNMALCYIQSGSAICEHLNGCVFAGVRFYYYQNHLYDYQNVKNKDGHVLYTRVSKGQIYHEKDDITSEDITSDRSVWPCAYGFKTTQSGEGGEPLKKQLTRCFDLAEDDCPSVKGDEITEDGA